jgi:hypothetical protein
MIPGLIQRFKDNFDGDYLRCFHNSKIKKSPAVTGDFC